ncbi:MAG TPA: BON domain-containing protein [Dehalococcoidia bacterium]|nr:BON domain-containing protein [Dehalococcoidia bacterium]
MTTGPMNKLRRLALLLADGTGVFDFVELEAFDDIVYLEGHVPSYESKRRAEELARYVGFTDIRNGIRVHPPERAPASSPAD